MLKTKPVYSSYFFFGGGGCRPSEISCLSQWMTSNNLRWSLANFIHPYTKIQKSKFFKLMSENMNKFGLLIFLFFKTVKFEIQQLPRDSSFWGALFKTLLRSVKKTNFILLNIKFLLNTGSYWLCGKWIA